MIQYFNYSIKPYGIVLIVTGMERFIEDPQYPDLHPRMIKEYEQGVRKMLSSHMVGRKKEYCHIEKLSNLDIIPEFFGFKIAAFPINILKAGAGWCRAVTIIEE